MIKVIIGNNTTRISKNYTEDTTLREALEAAEIDYAIGMTSLDGATLGPGDIDKTFADMGVTEKCYLMNVVKADNAACVKVMGGVAVIESSMKLNDLKTIYKFRPKMLELKTADGKDVLYSVATLKSGAGSMNKVGACFGVNATAAGNATITLELPEDCADPKAYLEDKLGASILYLNKIEEAAADVLADITAERESIRSNINVL